MVVLCPAVVFWYQDGNICSKSYYQNDGLHRDDGPADEEWFITEDLEKESSIEKVDVIVTIVLDLLSNGDIEMAEHVDASII